LSSNDGLSINSTVDLAWYEYIDEEGEGRNAAGSNGKKLHALIRH